MNKRIQKKVAKRHEQDQLGVADSYHEIEQGVRDLANALMTQGKEQSAAAIASMVHRLGQSEENLEHLVAKVPGLGPQLAGMLHNLSHGHSEQPEPDTRPVARKKPKNGSARARPSAGSRS